ncbi:transposase [Streptosporangium sp. NPDC050280]|uniref:transposase n=1 Tax=unclassified Streptosporangium TaxID=2632669 RepID=UPI0034346E5E
MDDRLKRDDLTDDEWARLTPLLPAHARRGNRWADHRTIIDGVFFRSRTGCPWRKLPEAYGNWKTVYNRYRRWSVDGTWETILDTLRTGGGACEGAPTSGTCSTAVAVAGRRPGDIRPGATFEIPNW